MNVVLISLDTTRADRLTCYGYDRPTSPNIDKIAAAGVRFDSFYSPHIPTYPGHTTMMTGRDIFSHQISGQSGSLDLNREIPMLAEILGAKGWFTGAADNLNKWFARGFQDYVNYDWDKDSKDGLRKGEAVNRAAMQVLDLAANQDKPFFLFFHYWDPHTPYLPPKPFSRMFYEGDEFDPKNRSMDAVWKFENFRHYFHEWMPGVTDIEFPKAQYDAEIAYMDDCLGQLFARLDELNLIDDTLLIITADHGEELDEHGCWFDHHGLYEPNVRIPCIMRLPGKIPGGKVVHGFGRTTDLVPTILDYAGGLDQTLPLDGSTLKPLIDCDQKSDGICDALFLTENTWMKKRAIRTHEWKLIRALEPDMHGFPAIELFDLECDPAEKRNIAAERPEIVEELSERLGEHIRIRTSQTGHPDPLPIHAIPLRSIGKQPTISLSAPSAKEIGSTGDFVGY